MTFDDMSTFYTANQALIASLGALALALALALHHVIQGRGPCRALAASATKIAIRLSEHGGRQPAWKRLWSSPICCG